MSCTDERQFAIAIEGADLVREPQQQYLLVVQRNAGQQSRQALDLLLRPGVEPERGRAKAERHRYTAGATNLFDQLTHELQVEAVAGRVQGSEDAIALVLERKIFHGLVDEPGT